MKNAKKNKRVKITGSYIVLWIYMAVLSLPLYVMIVGSFKPNTALLRIPPNLGLGGLTVSNYAAIISKSNLPLNFFNSLFISIMVSLITVFVALTAGYAFAKKRFAKKNFWFAILLATMMLPRQILLVPNYLVAKNFGLIDTLMGVVLTSIQAPLGVFLCKQHISTLPSELFEAAEIDGCSEIGIFCRLVFPLSKPVLGALTILCFITSWNDFMWQNILLTSKEVRTLPIAIAHMTQEYAASFGYQLAGAALSSIPILIVFILFQRYFVEGITMGAVKG